MQEVYRRNSMNERLQKMKKVRERAFEVYNYRNAEGEKAKEFLQSFLADMESWNDLRKFVYDDDHILDTLYCIAKRAGMEDKAIEFREACYNKILEDVKKERELRYPLQVTFILENYDHDATERLENVIQYLKPNDRNVLMLQLALDTVKKKDGKYDENAIEKLASAYGKLKFESSWLGRSIRAIGKLFGVN